MGTSLASRVRDLIGVASGRLLGRVSAGTGRAEELTAAQVRTLLEVYTQTETESYVSAAIEAISLTPGPAGEDGAEGLSAYEIALANGFVGDESAWLASLVGDDGQDGADGETGPPGPNELTTSTSTNLSGIPFCNGANVGTLTVGAGLLLTDGTLTASLSGDLGATANAIIRRGASAGTVQSSGVTIGDNNNVLIVSGAVSAVPLCIRGTASQSGNLTEWQNSAGTVSGFIDSAFRVSFGVNVSNKYPLQVGATSFAGPTDANTVAAFYNATFTFSSATVRVVSGATGVSAVDLGDASGTRARIQSGTAGVVEVNNGTTGTFRDLIVRTLSATGVTLGSASSPDVGIGRGGAGTLEVNNGTAGQLRDLFVRNVGAFGSATIMAQSAATVPATIRGAASQTANLTEWQNNAGTALSHIMADCNLRIPDSLWIGTRNYGVSPISRVIDLPGGNTDRGVARLCTSHSFTVPSSTWGVGVNSAQRVVTIGNGDMLTGESAAASAVPVAGELIATNGRGTNIAGANIVIGPGRSTGNATPATLSLQRTVAGASGTTLQSAFDAIVVSGTTVLIPAASSASIPVTVRGAASQTANLQEWQNSVGTALAWVSASGHIFVPLAGVIQFGTATHSPKFVGDGSGRTIHFDVGNNAGIRHSVTGAGIVLGVSGSGNQQSFSGGTNRTQTITVNGSDSTVDAINAGDTVVRGGSRTAGTNGNGGNVTITGGDPIGSGSRGLVLIQNLPTSDPGVTGALWNDGGALKISAG